MHNRIYEVFTAAGAELIPYVSNHQIDDNGNLLLHLARLPALQMNRTFPHASWRSFSIYAGFACVHNRMRA